MKKNLLISMFLFIAGSLAAQQLVIGNHDVVRLGESPVDAFLVEADAHSFYRISGGNSTSTDHPLLGPALDPDFSSIYFIKYDNQGVALKSNFIRGNSNAVYAASYHGGLTIMSNASEQVDANGQIIDIPPSSQVEFVANYDPDCQLERIIDIWALTSNQYPNSEAMLDPQDGSVYVYGVASQQLDVRGFGLLGKELETPFSYLYVIKYNRNLDFQWVYQAGFDAAQSGTSPSYNRIQVHPGKDGSALITGTYGIESSPLIHGVSLPSYMDGYGTFGVLLDPAGNSQWVQDGMLKDWGWSTRIFKGFSLPNGDFLLAGNTNTGYYKLGEAEFTFADQNSNNQFVFRINPAGKLIWQNQFDSQGPVEEGKKKSSDSEVMDDKIYYDAITWNNRLLYLSAPFRNPAFSLAGSTMNLAHPEGIYVAALDIWDGSELWGYALSSEDASLYGFDADQTGNITLMGSNSMTQNLDGITDAAVVPGDFLFYVGLDYMGKPLWYDNASLVNPPYYNLIGNDLEVLPNGEVFTSMEIHVANNIEIGPSVVGEAEYPNSSWMIELASDVVLGGMVTDADENPVYPGYVKAVKSAFWGCYPVVDSAMLGVDGRYLFDDLYPGNYALLAVPEMDNYPDAVPTYFGDQTGWQSASFHDIYPLFNSNINNIRLVDVPAMSPGEGSGQMSGAVYYADEERSMLKGTNARPAPKSAVILLKKTKKSTLADEVAAYTETDEYGMFAFNNVPDGDYLLHVEVPGLEMLETHEVTIVGDQIVTGLDYTISDNGVFIGWGVGVSLLENERPNIYPNPGPGLILVDLPAAGEYAIDVFAADGSLVMSRVIQSQGGASSMDISGNKDGIYFIRMKGPGTDTSIKYIKQ